MYSFYYECELTGVILDGDDMLLCNLYTVLTGMIGEEYPIHKRVREADGGIGCSEFTIDGVCSITGKPYVERVQINYWSDEA